MVRLYIFAEGLTEQTNVLIFVNGLSDLRNLGRRAHNSKH